MALKTNKISNECYDFTSIIEKSELVVLNDPLMIYSSDSSEDDCTIVLEPQPKDFTKNLDLSKIVFDGSCFQLEDNPGGSDPGENSPPESDSRVKDDMAVLDIVCSHHTLDRPEFVDIHNLTDLPERQSCTQKDCDVLELSDDDEVVFVKEYKEVNDQVTTEVAAPVEDAGIRRNPVRNVRNKARDLSKELLYEEDFAILDVSDDELDRKENKPPERKSSIELPKEWPINVHERPEYNSATKTIESLDYTLRDIQKKTVAATAKKAKLEAESARKKPKKKTSGRKRKPRAAPEEEKVTLETLKPLVNSTTDMLKDYFVNSRRHKDLTDSKSDLCTFENKLEILKNQAMLFSVVNNLDQNEVLEKFKQLNVENETKD